MSSVDQQRLINYLDGGGSVYMEGADAAFSHHTTPFFDYFGTGFIDTGEEEAIISLTGLDETFATGLEYYYFGGYDAHFKIDELSVTSGTALIESEDQKVRTVSNLTDTYRTICSSTLLGAFTDGDELNMRAFLMGQYIDFLAEETTSIEEDNVFQVTSKLGNNFPNPFNPTTTISFNLTAKDTKNVKLEIYNLKGQKVKQLVNEQLPAGRHSIIWDGKDANGKSVSSGIYFYKLKAGDFQQTRKMILMK